MAGLKLEDFIYTVKKELLDAQAKHEGEPAYFQLQKVELEANLTTSLEGEGVVKIAVVELGSRVKKENTHSVTLNIQYP